MEARERRHAGARRLGYRALRRGRSRPLAHLPLLHIYCPYTTAQGVVQPRPRRHRRRRPRRRARATCTGAGLITRHASRHHRSLSSPAPTKDSHRSWQTSKTPSNPPSSNLEALSHLNKDRISAPMRRIKSALTTDNSRSAKLMQPVARKRHSSPTLTARARAAHHARSHLSEAAPPRAFESLAEPSRRPAP